MKNGIYRRTYEPSKADIEPKGLISKATKKNESFTDHYIQNNKINK